MVSTPAVRRRLAGRAFDALTACTSLGGENARVQLEAEISRFRSTGSTAVLLEDDAKEKPSLTSVGEEGGDSSQSVNASELGDGVKPAESTSASALVAALSTLKTLEMERSRVWKIGSAFATRFRRGAQHTFNADAGAGTGFAQTGAATTNVSGASKASNEVYEDIFALTSSREDLVSGYQLRFGMARSRRRAMEERKRQKSEPLPFAIASSCFINLWSESTFLMITSHSGPLNSWHQFTGHAQCTRRARIAGPAQLVVTSALCSQRIWSSSDSLYNKLAGVSALVTDGLSHAREVEEASRDRLVLHV